MLPPEELKIPNFSKSIRGYNPEEVEQHMGFVIEKYAEIYNQNEILKKKLNAVTVRYERMKSYEDAIKAALIDAQTASSKLINETCERSELMLKNTEENCKKILEEYENKVKYQQYILSKMDEQICRFKSDLFNKYRSHIRIIEELSSEGLKEDEWKISEEDFFEKVLCEVKKSDENFDKENKVSASEDIQSEENLKKIDETVIRMIDNEKAVIDTKEEKESENTLRSGIYEPDKTVKSERQSVGISSTEALSGETKNAVISLNNDDDLADGLFGDAGERIADVDEIINENANEFRDISSDNDFEHTDIYETAKEYVSEPKANENEEDAKDDSFLISELSRVFGAESVDSHDNEKDVNEESDELDEEIRRLLEGITKNDN